MTGKYDGRYRSVPNLHRAYSSTMKRFIQPDPLGIDGGVNVYMWANMNPLAFIDPYGLEAWTNPSGPYGPGEGNQGGGSNGNWFTRSVNYVQGALKSIGSAAWTGVSYAGQAAWSAASFTGQLAWDAVSWTALKVWTLPNTALGVAWGALGYVAGALPGVQAPKLSFKNNAIQFENHPLMPRGNTPQQGSGITLGNAISYSGQHTDRVRASDGTWQTIGRHELQHTYQAQLLGPLYLPTYFVGSIISTFQGHHPLGHHHFMERGPYSSAFPTMW